MEHDEIISLSEFKQEDDHEQLNENDILRDRTPQHEKFPTTPILNEDLCITFNSLQRNHHQINLHHRQVLLNHLKLAYEFSDRYIRSSLGPYSRDKLIVKGDLQGTIMVTNDGRTLMEQMFKLRSMNENREQHPIHTLLYHLSKNQDTTIGDGTTSVVVLCGELCKLTIELIEKWGLSVDSIMKGYYKTCEYVLNEWLSIFEYANSASEQVRIERVSRFFNLNKLNVQDQQEIELTVAKSSLLSKQVKSMREHLASIAVSAVHITNGNLSFVKIDPLITRKEKQTISIRDSSNASSDAEIIEGGICLTGKSLSSNLNMPSFRKNCRVALFSCPIETPRLKTRHFININRAEQLEEFERVENSYFEQVSRKLEDLHIDLVISQWGFDNRFNDYLIERNLIGIRWVSAEDLDRIALASHATICARVNDLNEQMIGFVGSYQFDEDEKTIILSHCKEPRVCSIIVRAPNEYQAEETARSLNDALMNVNSVFTMFKNNYSSTIPSNSSETKEKTSLVVPPLVYGGGCFETEIYSIIMENLNRIGSQDDDFTLQTIAKYWAKSLLVIPATFAQNAGLSPVETVQTLIDKHKEGGENRYFGLYAQTLNDDGDRSDKRETDLIDLYNQPSSKTSNFLLQVKNMSDTEVIENVLIKKNMMRLATEMVNMIIKIDNVIYY
ncbi:hypothetical protein C9374_014153 [Naegleria lovaniensis]|uniref:Uncharacterized protein n=1 Tax=Naegleria lovaniensis TaxID=51637 RepID=A0AA88H248_NAELO|nr:uncharacterized protein C9374_014153 [Naegleria lovaniensis]KAG2389593.1 hypothetical protein C9374_014153 [Naegleria lovaniensis]